MISFLSIFSYQFFQNAVVAGILCSIVCGIIGVIISEKKLVMMSGGIAHASYGGVGLGYLIGIEPIIGAFLFSVGSAIGIGFLKRNGRFRSDVLIGLFWSFGMALGILFITLMPGYPPEISSYLFGSILSVTNSDLALMTSLTILVILPVAMLFNHWKAYMFDEEFATVMGLKTTIMEYVLFILIAMSVVVLIRAVGIILTLALLTAPTAIAGLFTKSIGSRMVLSAIAGAFFCLAGIFLSYILNIPSGAAIVIFTAIIFLLVYIAFNLRIKNRTPLNN
ncbi:MAG: metal ABC transporter permease [Spirochaetes bacterium]|nr:metal ABC transporter permease [Spirochaetota bacterium]